MDAGDLSLERCSDDDLWDSFVRASPQGTVFCTSAFLASLGVGCERWLICRRGEPLLAALLLVEGGRTIPAPYPLCMYHGIMLDARSATLPVHTRVRRTLGLVDHMLARLSEQHDALSFCLHHGFTDIRSLSWFNYHEPERGRFRLEVRYSAILDLAALDDLDGYLRTIRDVRRQEYLRARGAGLTAAPCEDLDVLEHLYRLTFERQGIAVEPTEIEALRSVAAAMSAAGAGEFLTCATPSGEVVAGTYFLRDGRYAYYWIGATDPAFRRTGAGTFVLIESMRRARAAGVGALDLVGVNSPNRGDYKTSFNAGPVPYVIADWTRPSS